MQTTGMGLRRRGGFALVQFGVDSVSLARHFEIGKNGEGLLEFLPFGLPVALVVR
jgi:hypothetical protein